MKFNEAFGSMLGSLFQLCLSVFVVTVVSAAAIGFTAHLAWVVGSWAWQLVG